MDRGQVLRNSKATNYLLIMDKNNMRFMVGVITGHRGVPDYRRAYGDSGKQCVLYLSLDGQMEDTAF